MKSRFKVLGVMSAVLLLFAMGGAASADNAASINIAVSYPCEADQNPCDTGVAVSRPGEPDFLDDGFGGDVVNVYITLLDAAGNPATAGPNGESLASLTGRLTTQLGAEDYAVEPNRFLKDDANVSFAGKASARANIDYTGAMAGVDPLNVDITGAKPLTATANVNVIAPDAEGLVVRTCGAAAPNYKLYDEIDEDCWNNGKEATAGDSIPVTVIAGVAHGLFTTAPNLEGKKITVEAYADYDRSESLSEDEESEPVATATFTMTNGIAQGNMVINSAGPAGLDVVFIATCEDSEGETIETEWLDGVEMIPGNPAKIVVGADPYENGNLIVPAEENCVTVLDDADECPSQGTPTLIRLFLVDALGNAVYADEDVTVKGALDGILAEQLTGCDTVTIPSEGYTRACPLYDDEEDVAGSIVIGPLPFTSPGLTGTTLSVYLLPASDCGKLDMQVEVEAKAPVKAGDTVTLTINSDSETTKVVTPGDDLIISAGGLLLSSSDFASATGTLLINNVLDADNKKAGIQVPVKIYSAGENVCITVRDLDKCGAEATTAVCITEIEPGDPANLAVVDVGKFAATKSALDKPGKYVGTEPIVISSYIIADGATRTIILDDADEGCCDLQLWDAYTNTTDCVPELECTTDSGFALPVEIGECGVRVAFAKGAVGTTVTVTCGVNIDADPELDLTRTFQLTKIVSEIPEGPEEPSGAATALSVVKEGPQAQNGAQINPLPGGEAIIKVLPNGELGAPVNVQISFGSGSVAGAELRNLDGSVINLPLTITLTPANFAKRYVVYAPTAGQVVVNVTEVSATGLAAGTGTVVFGAACEVAITPASPTVGQGGTLQLSATTTCEGAPTAGTYTWELLESACTSSGAVAANGLYSAPATADAGGCTETVRVTDTANGNVTADVIINVSECTPVVKITGNTSLTVGASQIYTAATTCGDAQLTGTYSWELNGAAVGTGNSYTFNATAAGSNTLKVTDTTNDVTATVTITVSSVSACSINVVQEQVARSRWIPLPAIITIVGDDTDITLATRVNYAPAKSPLSVIKMGKLVFKNIQTIQQPVLIMPSILTFVGFDGSSETVTVTLTNGGCNTASDTFTIEMLPIILDKK